jgi:hypothetical protein
MTVNAFSSDRGWLFQDILHQLYDAGAVTSHEPISGFDSYLCVRSSEAALSPRLDRTVVQIHCQEPRWIGSATALDKCAGFIFTHPAQAGILEGMGVKLDGKQTMCRPIGAKRAFTVRQSMPSRFTVGWVGRNSGAFKRINLYVEALELVNGIGVQAGFVSPDGRAGHHEPDRGGTVAAVRGSGLRRAGDLDGLRVGSQSGFSCPASRPPILLSGFR